MWYFERAEYRRFGSAVRDFRTDFALKPKNFTIVNLNDVSTDCSCETYKPIVALTNERNEIFHDEMSKVIIVNITTHFVLFYILIHIFYTKKYFVFELKSLISLLKLWLKFIIYPK